MGFGLIDLEAGGPGARRDDGGARVRRRPSRDDASRPGARVCDVDIYDPGS